MSIHESIHLDLGQIVATPGAVDALHRNNTSGLDFLRRHASGDWGMVCEDDKEANNEAVQSGARVLSAYFLPDETIIWLITDAQDERGRRRVTTFLLPEEY